MAIVLSTYIINCLVNYEIKIKNTSIVNIMRFLTCVILLSLGNIITCFPFPEECGITYIEPDNINNASRIVGGYEAVPGSWPWQAYLKWKGGFTCGGTLIHPQWVLSAGHCFYEGEDPADWEIVLGEFDDTVEDGWEQTRMVEKVIINPNYDPNLIDYDFTLIKLASPVELNDHVAPVCFPSETDDLETTFPPDMTCIVSGWGSIDPEGTVWGPTLKQDYAQLYSNTECQDLMGDPSWVTDRMICAGTSGNIVFIHSNGVCFRIPTDWSGGSREMYDSRIRRQWGSSCVSQWWEMVSSWSSVLGRVLLRGQVHTRGVCQHHQYEAVAGRYAGCKYLTI